MEDILFNFKDGIIIKNENIIKIDGIEEKIQNIKLEMVTTESDLFYNIDFGFSLNKFIHREIDELLIDEIKCKITTKLYKRDYIKLGSIYIKAFKDGDKLVFEVNFYIENNQINITVKLDRLGVEVV